MNNKSNVLLRFDALAATEVMGWAWDGSMRIWMAIEDLEMCMAEGFDWSPTTNEAHAAEVREKMRADGWEVIMTSHKRGDTVQMYRPGSSFVVTEEVGRMCYALTACALLAVSAIKEGELIA